MTDQYFEAYANEVRRLEARIKRLEEALRPFILYDPDEFERRAHDHSSLDIIVSFGDLRRARAALEDK